MTTSQNQEKETKNNLKQFFQKRGIFLGIVLAVVVIAGTLFYFNSPYSTGFFTGTTQTSVTQQNTQEETNPTSFAVRERYFEEVFKPKREEYKLFEKAAAYLGISINSVPKYFSLNNEGEIFAGLPEIPENFSQTAYALANGRFFSIGSLDEEYYKQPEFYPGFKTSGLRYWTEPDPKYWGTGGYGTYPSQQQDTLRLQGKGDFRAAVFFYTGYGVQTYQGVTIVPSSEALENFEIEISPDTFLIGPTFPKFDKGWAQKIFITGKPKQNTKPGKYTLGFLVVAPPKEFSKKWETEHLNLYFDAASAIKPSGYPIEFEITIEE